jgi:hypothetical protein
MKPRQYAGGRQRWSIGLDHLLQALASSSRPFVGWDRMGCLVTATLEFLTRALEVSQVPVKPRSSVTQAIEGRS